MILSADIDLNAPLGAQLLTALRAQIVSGALEPGARLSEKDIAGAYGLSRQPVREAFIKLAAEQLVEVRPQRGTFVRKIILAEVAASRFVREAVEADIVRLAAARATDDLVSDLRARIGEQRSRISEGPDVFIALDEQFHRSLAAAAGQAGAWDHMQVIKLHMDRVRHLTARALPVDEIIGQHAAIADAVEARDPAAAEAAMRGHLRRVLADLTTISEALPHYFGP